MISNLHFFQNWIWNFFLNFLNLFPKKMDISKNLSFDFLISNGRWSQNHYWIMKLRGHCMMDPLNRNPKAFDFIIDSLKVQSLFIVMPTWKKYSILNFLSMRSTCKSFIIVKRHVVQGWAKFLHFLPFSCYVSRFLQYRASTFVLPAFVPLGF